MHGSGRALLRVGVGLALSLVSAGGIAVAQSTPQPFSTNHAFSMPSSSTGGAGETQRASRRRSERDRPQARKRRLESRTRFRAQGAREALTTARGQFAETLDPVPSLVPRLTAGQRLGAFHGDHAVEVRGSRHAALVESLVPMRARDRLGRLGPASLRLVEFEDAYAPQNALVDVLLSKRPHDGFALARTGVGIVPRTAADPGDATRMRGKLFWGNVDTDTDLAVIPTAEGFETFHFLRSPASPERLVFDVQLPAGARLRELARPGAFEVVRGDDVLATIATPTAMDAAGQPVPVRVEREGAALVLTVTHRDAPVQYPIAVDPKIDGGVFDSYDWTPTMRDFAAWEQGGAKNTFWLDFGDRNACGGGNNGHTAAFSADWGTGLWICGRSGTYYPTGTWAQWSLRSMRPETTIYRADVAEMNHEAANTRYEVFVWKGPGHTDWERIGLSYPGMMMGWQTTVCARNPCGNPAEQVQRQNPGQYLGTPANSLVYRLTKDNSYGPYGNALLGRAYIYQWDSVKPTFTNSVGGPPTVRHYEGDQQNEAVPTKWHRDASLKAELWTQDGGFGVRELELERASASTGGPVAVGSPALAPCDGQVDNRRTPPCQPTFTRQMPYATADLPEGVNTLNGRVTDFSYNETPGPQWTVRVDRSKPAFDPTEFPSQVTNQSQTVEVTAADGNPWGTQAEWRSGVKRIDVYLTGPDGARTHVDEKVASTQACTVTRSGESRSVDHSCPMTMQYTFPHGENEYRPGAYAAEFVATDWVGNKSQPTVWSFLKVDVLDPEITALEHSPDPLPDGWLDHHQADVFADAQDPGFSGLYELDFTEPLLAEHQPPAPYRYRSLLDKTQPCEGNLTSPCPIRSRDVMSGEPEGTRSYDTDRWREGIVTASLQVRDAAGHTSKPPRTFQLKVDRMPPSVGYSGPVADNAYVVEPGISQLKVAARDGSKSGPEHERSGTVKLKIALDGTVLVDRTQTCPDGSCSMEDEITLDAATLDAGEHTLSVTSEDAIGHSETVEQPLWVEKQPGGVSAVADATGDSRDDLITVGSDGSLSVGASDGGTSFAAATSWGTWAGVEGVAAGDVDGDGDADLVGRTAGSADVLVALSSGSAFAAPVVWLAGADGVISLADVDSGGAEDLILRAADGTVRVAYAEGGAFIELSSWATVAADAVTLFGDVTGDELADLVTVTNGAIEVRRTDSVSFGEAEAWGTVGTEEFRVADADGDDLDDLLLRAGDGKITYRRSTETSFAAAQPTGTLAPTYHWSTGDVDADARADAVGRAGQTVVVSAGTAPYPENDGPGWSPDPGSPEDPEDPAADAAGGLTTQAVPGTTLRMAWADDDYTTERLLGQDASIPDPVARCAPAQVAFDRMRQPGSTYVRFTVLWSRYMDSTGTDQTKYIDALRMAVDCAQRAGLTPYFTLTSSYYDWPIKYNVNPDPGKFADFVEAVVTEFFPRGVTRYSMWNEPNLSVFLKVQCTGAAAGQTVRSTGLYRSLYSEGYDAARAASGQRAIVYIGELSELAHKGRSACGAGISTMRVLSTIDYLERLTTPGTTVRAHGVAWHAYQHRSRPNVQSAGTGIYDTERFQRAITSLHKQNLLRTPTDRKPGLYITEFGYWNVPLEGMSTKVYWSESTRAAWSRLALDRAARNGVRLFTFWQLNEAYDTATAIPLGNVRRQFDTGMLAPTSLDAGGTREYGKGTNGTFDHDHPRAAFCEVRAWGRGSGLPLGPATPAAPLPPGC